MADQTAPPPQQASIVEKTKEYLSQKDKSSNVQQKPAETLPPIPTGKQVLQQQQATTVAVTPPQSTALGEKKTKPAAKTSVRGMTNIVDALFMKQIIDERTLKSIKFESVTNNQSPEQLLLSRNLVTDNQLQQVKAEMYGVGFIDLSSVSIDNKVLNLISKDLATRNLAIAFEETSNRVKVAMVDPLDLQKVKFLEAVVRKRIDPYFATKDAIQRVLDNKYGAQIGRALDQAMEDTDIVSLDRKSLKVEDLSTSSVSNAPVAKIVNMILDYAIKHHASDVHIEPRESRIAVRYRVHGLLEEKLTLPPKLSSQIVTRIKILANMKIDEHRVPQDNRFQVKSGEKLVDIRVSVMPSIYGEKVVLRLLEKDQGTLPLAQTGLRGTGMKTYRNALNNTQGIILITGPTGSGKTVTLASSLAILNKQEVNIVTIEDPVEIRINGITQVQVNPEVGLTFAMGLRSFLRQDPDIIMVGEIRDSETAELAVQAALTGHLVLATLHTNSAAGALPRLLDMGIEPFLLSSTINVIVAQRLVRRLCDECKKPVQADAGMITRLHKELDGLMGFNISKGEGETIHFDSNTSSVTLYEPVGCPKCSDTGFGDRIGIFEVMPISDKIGQLIMKHESEGEIAKQSISEGMITMAQDGFMKVIEGVTTIEEVLRVQNN